MRFTRRTATLTASATLLVGGLLTAGTGPAQADGTPTVTMGTDTSGNYTYVDIYENGRLAGGAWWSRNPTNGDPGDALAAQDLLADGYSIDAQLSTGRVATTSGHDAPYVSPWKTGDLPENQEYFMRACLEKGDADQLCTAYYAVYS